MTRVMSAPNPKQLAFLLARTRFVAYGGARGGGKSWAVRKKATLLAMHYAGIRILVLRRSYPELRENHILPMMGELRGAARYKETEKAFLFANGSRIRFGYCDSEGDVLQYQGQEFDVIFIDEATQFTEYQFHTLTACIRGANDFPKRMYLTCNPGGVGHAWVKRLFIDRQYREGERAEDYTFIPARVYDNAALMEQDGGYVQMLESLPEDLRRAWLDGDWNVFAGQYFREFSEEAHVCEPFEIPRAWRRYFAMDYGLDMLAGYFIAVDRGGRAYVYREIYQSGLIISEAARVIRACGEDVEAYYAPPDLWNRRQDTGKSAYELFLEGGVPLTKASNDRVQGWMNVKEWLKVGAGDASTRTFSRGDGCSGLASEPDRQREDESPSIKPRLQIFRCCTNLIRTLPQLQFDPHNPCDVATEPHELTHAPDALRYFIAARPRPAATPVQRARESDFRALRERGEIDHERMEVI